MEATLNRRTRARSTWLGGLVAAGLLLAPVSASLAQDPPAGAGQPGAQQPTPSGAQDQQQQQPQPQEKPAAPSMAFEGEAGVLFIQVKPDKVNDFEAIMGKLHEALSKTDKPERKQQATGWKIYKSTDPGAGGNVTYIAMIDPVLKGADYDMVKILAEVFPTEVHGMFPFLRDSLAGPLSRANLVLVQDFGAPAKPAPPLPAGAQTPPDAGSAGTSGGTQPAPTSPNQ